MNIVYSERGKNSMMQIIWNWHKADTQIAFGVNAA